MIASKKNNNTDLIRSKKKEIYLQLKNWDAKRSNILKYHLKIVKHILNQLDAKIKASKQYLSYIQNLILRRIGQIERYIGKGLTKSEFVLSGNLIRPYQNHHNLLKQLTLVEGKKQEHYQLKKVRLIEILNDFKTIKQSSQHNQSNHEQHINDSYSSSLIIMKYNVRQVIQCQMPQLISLVVMKCKQVSDIYNSQSKEDLYLAITDLISGAQQQYYTHKKISKQLINLIRSFIERQENCNFKLKNTLLQYMEEQKLLTQQISEQLLKTNDRPLIQDFYNIEDMLIGFQQCGPTNYPSIEQFIKNFTIESFTQHLDLIVCEFNGLYNQKVQVNIIITVDCYVHLKKVDSQKVDFSFILQKGLQLKKQNDLCLLICQKKKKRIIIKV